MVELMVVIFVFTIISIITITTFPQFSNKTDFSKQILDIALNIRQAQAYGMSVKEFGSGSGNFNKVYGIHFETANLTSYVLFTDDNDNGRYDSGEIIGLPIAINSGFSISNLYVTVLGIEENKTELDIVFKRPEPDATITPAGSLARIVVKDSENNERSVFVTKTGQIYTD